MPTHRDEKKLSNILCRGIPIRELDIKRVYYVNNFLYRWLFYFPNNSQILKNLPKKKKKKISTKEI